MTDAAFARLQRLAATAGLTVETGTSHDKPALKVGGMGFVTVRPDGLVSLRLPMEQKEFLLEAAPDIYLENDHFKAWPWLLLRLDVIDDAELTQRLVDAWCWRAPKRLAARFSAAAGTP